MDQGLEKEAIELKLPTGIATGNGPIFIGNNYMRGNPGNKRATVAFAISYNYEYSQFNHECNIALAPAFGAPLRKLVPLFLRGSGFPVGQKAISFIINAGSHASVS